MARRLQKPSETFDELRDEAIAALCLPDIDDGGPQWKTACPASDMAFDTTGQGYVQVDEGHAYYCRLVDGKEQRLKELHVSGRALAGEWHSPDLRFLALRSPHILGKGSDWLKLWRCDGPQAKLVLEDRGISEHATAFRPDGRQLAVGHRDGTLTVHDTETGAVVRQWQVGVPPTPPCSTPAFPAWPSLAGSRFASTTSRAAPCFPPGSPTPTACRLPPGTQTAEGWPSTALSKNSSCGTARPGSN